MVKNNTKNENMYAKVILWAGIILRVIVGLMADPKVNQHDVTHIDGHFDYAMYIYKNWQLPKVWSYEYAQPPINAFLQALWMKICNAFHNFGTNYWSLYSCCNILSIIYAVLTIIIIYKILKELNISTFVNNFVLTVMAIYPGLIFMVTQYNNDGISYLFFFLAIYRAIIWCKSKKLKDIIWLALSIGIGMLTKISVGLIAFIVGPMMLIILIRDMMGINNVGGNPRSTRNRIWLQLLIFALIVFPIGLSFSIRNLLIFNVYIGRISEIAINTPLDMKRYHYSIVDRFLSFPIDRLYTRKYAIYHDMTEYNIWVDLLKTATYDEFDFGRGGLYKFHFLLYICNIAFFAAGLISIIYNIVNIIKNLIKLVNKQVGVDNNFLYICIMLFILAIFAYVSFNVRYAYSCNSNWRYIAYITFAMAGSIALMIEKLIIKRDK